MVVVGGWVRGRWVVSKPILVISLKPKSRLINKGVMIWPKLNKKIPNIFSIHIFQMLFEYYYPYLSNVTRTLKSESFVPSDSNVKTL